MSDIQHTDPANNYGRSTEIPMLESQAQDNPFKWYSLLWLLFKITSDLLLNNCSSSAKRHCESKKTAGQDFLKYFPVELRHISAYLQLFARAGRWWKWCYWGSLASGIHPFHSCLDALQATLTERIGVITYHHQPPASAPPNVSQATLDPKPANRLHLCSLIVHWQRKVNLTPLFKIRVYNSL